MSNVDDFFTEKELKDIRTKALTRRKNVDCMKIAEDKPEIAFIGQGLERCAFITNTDNEIVKVAKNKQGIKANKRASNAFLVSQELADKTFAMPKDVDKNGVAMVQEEAETFDSKWEDEKEERLEIPESLKDTELSEGQLDRVAEKNMDDKLEDVYQDSGVRCLDVVRENLGFKDDNLVMLDLGECKKPEEIKEGRIKVKQPR